MAGLRSVYGQYGNDTPRRDHQDAAVFMISDEKIACPIDGYSSNFLRRCAARIPRGTTAPLPPPAGILVTF